MYRTVSYNDHFNQPPSHLNRGYESIVHDNQNYQSQIATPSQIRQPPSHLNRSF